MKSIAILCIFLVCGYIVALQAQPTTNSISSPLPFAGNNLGNPSMLLSSAKILENALYSGKYSKSELMYQKIEGSPYLFEDSSNGTLVLNDGRYIPDVPIRYDIYLNEIIATATGGKEILLDTEVYKEMYLELNGKKHFFKKINPEKPTQFYNVLYEDEEIVIYKESFVKLQEGQNMGVSKTEPRFYRNDKYYFLPVGKEAQKLKLKKKDILKKFSKEEQKLMLNYAKQMNYKWKSEVEIMETIAAARQYLKKKNP